MPQHKYRCALALGAITLASISLTGCFTEEIDARQTHEIQGLLYKINADDPFTGRVLNYPISVLDMFTVGSCTVEVKKGLPHGQMQCSNNSGVLVATGEFKQGKRDGKEEKFDPKTGSKTAVNHWSNGLQDGEQEQFNPLNGERILQVNYKAGKKEGRERAWNKEGNETIADLEWKNGLQSGFDNRGTQHRTYLNGKLHGPQKEFGIANNRFYIAGESSYENGILHGTQKKIDAFGNVTELAVYENDNLKSRTIDKYSYSGKHLHHYSSVALKEEINRYIESDMSKDGLEQYWDEDGRLIRELKWDNGNLLSAIATVWIGAQQDSQYQGVLNKGYGDQRSVVKHGQERLYDDDGELQAIIFWESGNVTQKLVALPPEQRRQFPEKIGVLDKYSYSNPVEEKANFEEPSRFIGANYARQFEQLVDIPIAGQFAKVDEANVKIQQPSISSTQNIDPETCVQNKVDSIHAEDPEALIRADMLQEFEQECQ